MMLPKFLADRLFEDRQATETRRQDALDALDWLASKGALMSPGLFWQADPSGGGVSLLDSIKRAQKDELYRNEPDMRVFTYRGKKG